MEQAQLQWDNRRRPVAHLMTFLFLIRPPDQYNRHPSDIAPLDLPPADLLIWGQLLGNTGKEVTLRKVFQNHTTCV